MDDWRQRFAIEGAVIHKIQPGHGPCCTCQTCGYPYDECKCSDNLAIEACDYIEQLQAENAQLQAGKRGGICMYCGYAFVAKSLEPKDIAVVYEQLIAHDKQCPKNPLVKRIGELEAENARLKEERAELRICEGCGMPARLCEMYKKYTGALSCCPDCNHTLKG